MPTIDDIINNATVTSTSNTTSDITISLDVDYISGMQMKYSINGFDSGFNPISSNMVSISVPMSNVSEGYNTLIIDIDNSGTVVSTEYILNKTGDVYTTYAAYVPPTSLIVSVDIELPQFVKDEMFFPYEYLANVKNFDTGFISNNVFDISIDIDKFILDIGNNNMVLALKYNGKETELRYNLHRDNLDNITSSYVHLIDTYTPVIPLSNVIEKVPYKPNKNNNINIEEIESILNRLKSSTNTMLKDIQHSKCPHYYDIRLEKVDRYVFMENEYNSKEVTLQVLNQKYIRRESGDVSFRGPLIEAINQKIVYPFILFNNRVNIDINNINIIIDNRSMYLEFVLFGNIEYELSSDTPINISAPTNITLPYIDDDIRDVMELRVFPNSNVSTVVLNDVSITLGNISRAALSVKGPNVLTLQGTSINKISFKNTKPAKEFYIDIDKIDCILIPQDVEFVNVDRTTDLTDIHFVLSGGIMSFNSDFANGLVPNGTGIKIKNTNKLKIYDGVVSDNIIEVIQDPQCKIYKDTTFITDYGVLESDIKDYQNNVFEISNNFSSRISYKSFYFEDSESLDNITRFTKMSNYIDRIKNNLDIPALDSIINPLDFTFELGVPKIDRIFNILEILCKYNSYLLDDYVSSKSDIESKIYPGIQIKQESDIVDGKHVYSFNKYVDIFEKNECMVFVNGLLYDESLIDRQEDDILITFENIDDSDEIEFLVFKRVNNYISTTRYDHANKEYLIGNYIEYRDLEMSTYDIHNHIYRHIPKLEELQYDVSKYITPTGRGYIDIDLPIYYNSRDIYIGSKRKFLHNRYVIKDNETMIKELYKILIPDEFKFCNNRKQYLFFHNGRKIPYNDAQVCLNKWNLPFDKRFIHLNKKCQVGDIIDIYYVPDEMAEILFEYKIDPRGYITVDQDSLGYPLTAKNSSIFVNGKKLNSEYVENISNREVKINHDIGSIRNVSILKHISYHDEVFEMIRSFRSAWDRMIGTLSNEDKDSLFGFSIFIQDIENDLRGNIYSRRQVLYEILRRYWLVCSNKVKVENPLFDISDIDGKLVLPINSTYKYNYNIAEYVIKKYQEIGITKDFIDANDEIVDYVDFDIAAYVPYYQEGLSVIPNNSNVGDSDLANIIDIIIRDLGLDPALLTQFTVDAVIEYVIKYTEDSGIPIFNSIDASIIHPYNYDKLITIGHLKNYPIFPIPINSEEYNIMDLPRLYDEDSVTTI